MKCNLIVPGFAKCGTSSLHEYLNMHPNICMSATKEPHYFSHNEVYARGYKWHDSLFYPVDSRTTLVYGESSTSYCYDETALRRIRDDIENPKIILIMRSPVDRLLSHFRWLWALKLENRSLIQAVEEEASKEYDIHHSFKDSGNYATYLRGSQYSVYVPMMESIFGQANVLCISSQQLREHPSVVLSECFQFLEIAPHTVSSRISENQTKDKLHQRTLGLERLTPLIPRPLYHRLNSNRRLKRVVLSALGKQARTPPQISSSVIEAVAEMLTQDIDFFHARFTSNVEDRLDSCC